MAGVLQWTGRAIFVWPFILLWRLVTLIEKAVGIMLCLLFGLALMGLGVLLTSTFFGAPIGIPLFILGFLLLIRGLF